MHQRDQETKMRRCFITITNEFKRNTDGIAPLKLAESATNTVAEQQVARLGQLTDRQTREWEGEPW